MLSQMVRPLVDTQIRLLANSEATGKTLAQTIVCWLGYLGVGTEVSQLIAEGNRITVSLSVGKPDSCNPKDWQKILNNLLNTKPGESTAKSEEMEMAKLVQLSRLLAYVIQMGSSETTIAWDILESQLSPLNLDSLTLQAIRSALKVPQSMTAIDKLDPDLAARAFPLAVKIAWMDGQVTAEESEALKALLTMIAPEIRV